MRLTSRLTCAFKVIAALIALVCSEATVSAREVDENRPIGAVGGVVHGDPFTATATMSVPIEVAPGTNNIQPSLALTYASTAGNGWVGVGWKLEMGSIERQTRFGVDYSKNDFSIQMSGTSTDLVAAPPPASTDQYVAKIEGAFLRIKKLNSGFEVTDKKGTKYLFGSSNASRLADPTDSSKVFKWFLDRVEDRDGNFMTAAYVADSGQLYLEHIDYTGHGAIAPIHAVRFYLEGRPDAPTMYSSGFPITTGKRLKSIEVKANGNFIRAYSLNYGQGPNSGRSQLSQVQEYGRDAVVNQVTGGVTPGSSVVLPPLSLTWKGPANHFGSESLMWVEAGDHAPIRFGTGDINGDGKADLLRWQARNGWAQADYALSTGTGYGPFVQYVAWGGAYDYSGYSFVLADFNADGAADMIVTRADGTRLSLDIALWTGSSFGASTNVFEKNGNYSNYQFSFGDINGDGKTDVMAWKAVNGEATASYALSTPTAYGPLNLYTSLSGPYNYSGHVFQLVDMNGDSRADMVLTRADSTRLSAEYSLWNGTSFGSASSVFGDWNGDYSGFRFVFGDINADSRADMLVWKAVNNSAVVHYAINRGSGFGPMVQHINWGSGYDYTGYGFQLLDVNSDGCADLVITRYHQTRLEAKYALSNGVSFGNIVQVIEEDGYYEHEQVFFIDINGDGMPDYARTRADAMEGHLWVAFETASAPDLLVATQNGLGGATIITYTPSTQLGTTHTQLPFPVQTVSTITTCDNWNITTCVGTSATTQYSYSGGYFHLIEREFRGFNYAKVTGPVGPNGEQAISETWFHQGNDVAVGVNSPAGANGYTKGLPYRTKVADATGKVHSEITTIYSADADGVAPFFTPVAQVDTSIENGAKQLRMTYPQYDLYGNVLREDQYGDLAVTSDDRTVIRTFANNTTDWLLGFPLTETTYAGLGTTTQVAQVTLYYDGTTNCATPSVNQVPTKGHVTRTVRWLNGGTSPESRVAYDALGNPICMRDANGNTTTLTYDNTNTFTKTVTNPLGHVVATQYYGVDGVLMDKGLYGQVKSLTDANAQTVLTEYDMSGRKNKTTFPDGLVTTVTYNYGAGFTVGTQHVLTSTSGASLVTTLTSASYFDGLGRGFREEKSGPDGKTVVTEMQFDSRGTLWKKSLPYFKTLEAVTGRWTTTTHDALGRVTRLDSPDGLRGLSCYTDWVIVTIDAADHRKREVKDAYGRTIRVDEYAGTFSSCSTEVGTPYATTTYQYDTVGNMVSLTDAKGNVSSMTYDTLNRKTAMHDPDMGNWSYVYDAMGNLTKQTDAKAQLLWFRYDTLNRLAQKDYTTQKALGSGDVRYIYDGTTNNRQGRLQQVVDTSGTATFQYDAMGRITQSDKTLDGTSYITQSTYDGLGRLLTVTYPGSPTITISYAYNGPILDKVFQGNTIYVQYTNYNALGQAATTTYGNGVTTTQTYANTSNTVCSQQNFRLCTLVTTGPGSGGGSAQLTGSFTAPATMVNISTEGTADWTHWGLSAPSSFNRKSGVTAQISNFTAVGGGTAGQYSDNISGYTWTGGTPTSSATNSPTGLYMVGVNKGFQFTVPADTTQRSVKVYVSAWGAQGKMEAFLSDSSSASYTDTSLSDPGGSSMGAIRVYTFTYKAASPGQTLTIRWTNLVQTDPNGGNVTLQAATLVTSGGGGGGGGSTTTYDSQLDFGSVQGTHGWYYLSSTGTQLTWNGSYWTGTDGFIGLWDSGGHPGNNTDAVRRWVAPQAGTLHLTGAAKDWDPTSCGGDGAVVILKKNGTVLWQRTIAIGDSVGQSFDLTNTVAIGDQIDLIINRNSTTTCDNTDFYATLMLTTGGGSGIVYQDLRYVYSANGNISDIYDNLMASGAGDQHLSYDALDRLTLANGPYGTNGATASLTYTYDELGNLTFNSQIGSYTYPSSGATSVRPHAASTAGSSSYSYDANGNLTNGAGRTLTYNLENKPLTITISGQTTTFVYDGDGGRVKKISGALTTRYITKLYECDNTSCSRMIFSGGERIATLGASGAIYYYHTDHLGSSSVITDSLGAKVQAVTYFPFGATRTNTSSVTPTVDVPYKYTGQELDSSTNLYYYEARYYDPVLGRFLSADTIVPSPLDPQSLNRYSYVHNNPFKYNDPTGHFSLKIHKFLNRALGDVGIAVVGVALQSYGTSFILGGNFTLGNLLAHTGTATLTQSQTGRTVLQVQVAIAGAALGPAVGAGVGGLGGPLAGGASSGAFTGMANTAIAGGSLEDVVKATLKGAFTGAIGGAVGGIDGLQPHSFEQFFSGKTLAYITAKAAVAGMQGFAGGLLSGRMDLSGFRDGAQSASISAFSNSLKGSLVAADNDGGAFQKLFGSGGGAVDNGTAEASAKLVVSVGSVVKTTSAAVLNAIPLQNVVYHFIGGLGSWGMSGSNIIGVFVHDPRSMAAGALTGAIKQYGPAGLALPFEPKEE